MNRLTKLLSSLALALLMLSPMAGRAADSFKVVATIKPIHAILSGLMAGTTEPELLATGGSPYGLELSAAQRKSIREADLIVWVGPELETFMLEPLGQLGKETFILTLLDLPALKILDSRKEEGKRDPIFWLDSRNAMILINELARLLMDMDPAHAHVYARNRRAIYAKAAALDRQLEYGYRGLKGGVGLSYYDTLQYFEQAYALKIGGAITTSPVSPLDAQQLLDARRDLRDGVYACLLVETGEKPDNLPLLTSGIDIRIGELDTFGANYDAGPDLYFRIMEHNTSVIKSCLRPASLTPVSEEEAKHALIEEAPGEMEPGRRFMLIDHNGELFTDKDMLGKYQLIAFGYTSCPDICPTSLTILSSAMDLLGKQGRLVQPYFITVDPERDTAAVMKEYVGHFHKDLIGLTGSPAMIDRVAKAYKVRYEKVREEGAAPDDYIMNHSASIYFMAPNGEFITKFAYGLPAEEIVRKIRAYLPKN